MSYGRALLGIGFVCVMIGGCVKTVGDDSDVVATWEGGRINQTDHASWLEFHGLEESPESLREHAFVESLAAASRSHHADQEPRTRLEVEAARRQILLPALRDHVLAGVTVSDDEVEALRADHPEAFQRPRKLKLRNIFKRIDDQADAPIVRRRMETLLRQLRDGADFGELARSESESQSRFRDGQLGWVAVDDLPDPVADAVRNLAPGERSEIVAHGGGLSIFVCDDVREALTPTADEVRSKIRSNLMRLRRTERWSRYQADLLEDAHVRIDPAAAVVLEMDGYQLGADDLAVLVELRSPKTSTSDLTAEQLEGLLRGWAVGVAGCRKATELGLDASPKVAAGLGWAEIDAVAHRELVRRVDAKVEEPSEAELRHLFETAPKGFWEPAAWHILVLQVGDADDHPDPQALVDEATAIARRLELGDLTFAEAAKRYSRHPSASRGGDIGWKTRRQLTSWDPAVSRAVSQLSPGQQTGVLRLRTGLWILEVRDFRQARELTFDEALPQLREAARKQQIRRLEESIRDEQLAAIGWRVPSPDPSATATQAQ